MKETVHFTKMQGAGNDYIYVDTQQYDIPDPEKAAIAWSAYHTGIGSDGLVLIGKPHDGIRADYSMRIFNADGSEAMMCGNASRCIGKYLYEKGLTPGKRFRRCFLIRMLPRFPRIIYGKLGRTGNFNFNHADYHLLHG